MKQILISNENSWKNQAFRFYKCTKTHKWHHWDGLCAGEQGVEWIKVDRMHRRRSWERRVDVGVRRRFVHHH